MGAPDEARCIRTGLTGSSRGATTRDAEQWATPEQRAENPARSCIAEAYRALTAYRDAWLYPPEWDGTRAKGRGRIPGAHLLRFRQI